MTSQRETRPRNAPAPAPDRAVERALLRWTAALLVLYYVGLVLQRRAHHEPATSLAELVVVGGYLGGLLLLHRLLTAVRLLGDEKLVPLVGFLTGLGLLVRFRLGDAPLDDLSPRLLVYPGAMATLALAAWVCRWRVTWLERGYWLAGLLATGLLAAIIYNGVRFRGAMYGPGLTTPSEAIKLLMVVFLAGFLSRRRGIWELLGFAVLWCVPQFFLWRQSDLGLMVILTAVLLSMFYVATGRTRFLLVGLAGAVLAVVVLYYAAPLGMDGGHGERRITAWLHPWDDPDDTGFQALQALFALRAGGWDGAGLGGGHPDLTPLVESDFVYAALAEELGLIGSCLVLLLYLILFRRGYVIASLAAHPFRQRLAIGCVTVLAIQTLINVGGVVRLMPITGITLPFISHGGSSLLVSHALVGVLLAVGHEVMVGEPEMKR